MPGSDRLNARTPGRMAARASPLSLPPPLTGNGSFSLQHTLFLPPSRLSPSLPLPLPLCRRSIGVWGPGVSAANSLSSTSPAPSASRNRRRAHESSPHTRLGVACCCAVAAPSRC
eukprot:1788779-Pleurochrysis_carterae.AAC.1